MMRMMRCLASLLPVQDLACLATFLVVNAASFLFSYRFLVDADASSEAVRMQASILLYGSAQSLIGYLGGFYAARIVYGIASRPPRPPREYEFVKSDDDILDE